MRQCSSPLLCLLLPLRLLLSLLSPQYRLPFMKILAEYIPHDNAALDLIPSPSKVSPCIPREFRLAFVLEYLLGFPLAVLFRPRMLVGRYCLRMACTLILLDASPVLEALAQLE